jgi:hypothetical protein
MKRRLLLTIPLFVTQLGFAEATGDARDVRTVRSADREPRASLLGQPSIALWKEKHLIVAYQKGVASGDLKTG